MSEDSNGLHWHWDFIDGLFVHSLIANMHQHFSLIMHALAENDWQIYHPLAVLPVYLDQLNEFQENSQHGDEALDPADKPFN